MIGEWQFEERVGDAGTLHASWPLAETYPTSRAVAVCRVTGPALVLGSTQPDGVVDAQRAEKAGVAVVRRRSGGGVVLVAPDDPVWIDVWVPRDDPLWRDDVVRAFDWLGDAWVAALDRLGSEGISANRGGYAASTWWSALICFGGVGTGEVVTADGRKVVGMSQRRTRKGTWFHSATFLRWDPSTMLDVLDLPDDERTNARADLGGAVVGVTGIVPPSDHGPIDRHAVVASLVASLP